MTFLSSFIAGREAQPERVSVSLMTTYACQLDCAYCQVLKRSVHASKKTVDAAIAFLARSGRDKVELKFFGGEPLLKFDLIKYAVRRAKARLAGKDVQFALVTNGIALDREKAAFLGKIRAVIIFSFDGDAATHARFRASAAGNPRYGAISANLKRLAAEGAGFFANVVVSPANLRALKRNLNYIASLGVKRLNLCYNGAAFWSDADILLLVKTLAAFLDGPAGGRMSFLNATGEAEPVALKTDLIVDTDGLAYMDAAIFMEKRFPLARKHFLLGEVSGLGKPEDVYSGRMDHLRRWRRCVAGREEEEKIFISTLKAGAALKLFFTGRRGRSSAP